VVNDEVDGDERVDLGGISTEAVHGITHGGKIDNRWYTSKILKYDSRRSERNFSGVLRGFSPVEDGVNVMFLHREVVAVTDGTLEEDTDGIGEG
jgi:hypothetical protein